MFSSHRQAAAFCVIILGEIMFEGDWAASIAQKNACAKDKKTIYNLNSALSHQLLIPE